MPDFDPEEVTASGLRIEAVYCPSCNRENRSGVTFCAHCATYLGDLLDSESPGGSGGDDALDNLKAAPEPPPPPPPDPRPPTPVPSARPSSASSSSAPPKKTETPSSVPARDPDLLPQPVTLPDGRVIRKASTLAKLQKLQQIAGGDPLGGARSGGNDVVAYLEKKVADQTALIEQLKQEKEALVQEFMVDALEGDENALAEELGKARRRIKELEAAAKAGGAGGADLEAATRDLAEAREEVARLRSQVELASEVGNEAERLAKAEAELESLRAELAASDDARIELAGRVEAAEARARGAPAATSGGEELESLRNEAEDLRARLTQMGETAREQVQSVTRYYERILARSPCGLVVMDGTGSILSANLACSRLLGVPTAQILRKPYLSIPAFQEFEATVNEVMESGNDSPARPLTISSADGNQHRVRYTCSRAEIGTRKVCVVIMEVLLPAKPAGAGDPGGLREDLFGLRMMVELLSSKAHLEDVVTRVSGDILADVDRMLEAMKSN